MGCRLLVHERYHLRHRDPLRVVVARYFAAGLYVVPVVEELASFYALQKEIAADDDAVRHVGIAPLARALYKLLPDAPDGECQEWACAVCGDDLIIGLPAPAYVRGGSTTSSSSKAA